MRATTFACAAWIVALACAALPGDAQAQSPAPQQLEAINEAIEEANAAARRAEAAAAAQSQPQPEDGRPKSGSRGFMGAAPPAYPAGVPGPARPKGPGGRSRAPAATP